VCRQLRRDSGDGLFHGRFPAGHLKLAVGLPASVVAMHRMAKSEPVKNDSAVAPQALPAMVGAPTRGLIDLLGINKRFGTLDVLVDLSLSFEKGKTTVVIGESGTGKSVLLKHIVVLLRPDTGEVHFRGQRIDQLRESALATHRMR